MKSRRKAHGNANVSVVSAKKDQSFVSAAFDMPPTFQ